MIALEKVLPSPFKKLGRSTEWILQLFVRGGKRVRFLAAPSTFESYCPSLLYPPARKKPFSPSSTHSSVAQGSPSPPLSALLLSLSVGGGYFPPPSSSHSLSLTFPSFRSPLPLSLGGEKRRALLRPFLVNTRQRRPEPPRDLFCVPLSPPCAMRMPLLKDSGWISAEDLIAHAAAVEAEEEEGEEAGEGLRPTSGGAASAAATEAELSNFERVRRRYFWLRSL